jgi:hypothetical protein
MIHPEHRRACMASMVLIPAFHAYPRCMECVAGADLRLFSAGERKFSVAYILHLSGTAFLGSMPER